MLNLKSDFPFFKENPGIIYLDSAATTQKPKLVIETLVNFYTKDNATASRSSYSFGSNLTRKIQGVRQRVQKFLNAKLVDEIIFTAGSTDSFNKIAVSLAFNYLEDGDEIMYCPSDHKSFIFPWFNLKDYLKNNGKNIALIPFKVKKNGGIDIEDLISKLTPKTKVVNLTHVHNVYGTGSDIHLVKDLVGNEDVIINVDATQSVGHMTVDAQALNVDILSFSGHKMFASQGVGVTYVNQRWHRVLKPMFVGGGKGIQVDNDELQITDFVQSYEVGTQNYAGILTLGKAIEYIEHIGIKEIESHLSKLTNYLLVKLREIDSIEFTFGPHYWSCSGGVGILSFNMDGIPASELGFILSDKGLLVRSGDHCTSFLDGLEETIRISLHIYNDEQDIDMLIKVLKDLG